MNIKIKKITVHLDDAGPDYIYLTPEVETPFPILQYEASMKMAAQAGYGVEWVKKTFNRDPDEVLVLRTRKT